MELDSIDPTSATLLGQVGLSPSPSLPFAGSSVRTQAPGPFLEPLFPREEPMVSL